MLWNGRPPPAPPVRIPDRVIGFDEVTYAPIWSYEPVPRPAAVDPYPAYRSPPGGRKGWGVRGLGDVKIFGDGGSFSSVVLLAALGAFLAPKEKRWSAAALGGAVGLVFNPFS